MFCFALQFNASSGIFQTISVPEAPVLLRKDYYTVPSIDQLANMDELQLRNIEGFRVGRVGFGEVGWEGALPAGGPYTCMSRMTALPCVDIVPALAGGVRRTVMRCVCCGRHAKKCLYNLPS